IEVAGQVGQLRPGFGQGLGFTAIIVAFLGRLSPLGAVLAALVIAVLLIGAESAQVSLKLPLDLARFFMGLLLICILLGESLERYRIRFRRAEKERQA
ncbi:MAG: ABC transporter permease subunit, partial [Rhabdaerophilum calidifontis]